MNSATRIRDQNILGLVMSELRAECRSSGNASAPPVHFRLMDRSHFLVAARLPFRSTGTNLEDGLPKNGDALVTAHGSPQASLRT